MVSTKLQKADVDTNAIIDAMRLYLVEYYRRLGIKGLTITREMAWDFFQVSHKLPYLLLIERNPIIQYQGKGKRVSKKLANQQLVIKEIGKFVLQGVSGKADQPKKAAIKFTPSKGVQNLLTTIKVEDEDE